MIDINGILKLLPQRFPFILIDKVLEYEANKRIVALKNVTINEPFFQGHFPGNPVMPGVLILEAMAQASAVLGSLSAGDEDERAIHLFAGIDNARFKQMVLPGDQLQIEIECLKYKQGIWKMHGQASVDGKIAAVADLMSAKKVLNSD